MLNEPNVTYTDRTKYPQQMNTGKNDWAKVRQYTKISNQPYTTFNKSWFDGNTT